MQIDACMNYRLKEKAFDFFLRFCLLCNACLGVLFTGAFSLQFHLLCITFFFIFFFDYISKRHIFVSRFSVNRCACTCCYDGISYAKRSHINREKINICLRFLILLFFFVFHSNCKIVLCEWKTNSSTKKM